MYFVDITSIMLYTKCNIIYNMEGHSNAFLYQLRNTA